MITDSHYPGRVIVLVAQGGNMTVSIDSYDRKILFELDCNSRRPLSEVARKVRLGRDLVVSRMARLHESGVLRRCTALINPYKLGYTLYKTYLKLEANRERHAQLVTFLNSHPATFWLAECYGSWDLIWCIAARTPKEAYDIQDLLFSEYSDVVSGYGVYTFVNNWWFPKKNLLGATAHQAEGWNFKIPEVALGMNPDQITLDDLEKELLKLLSMDSQVSVTELAELVKSTPAVVKYRLEKLEKSGVIAGYRVELDRALLGLTLFNVQLQLRNFNGDMEREFHTYCRNHPLVLEYIQQLGSCKLELVVEAKDYIQFSSVVEELRERFSRIIKSFDYLMIKRDYFHRTPRCLFDGARHWSELSQAA